MPKNTVSAETMGAGNKKGGKHWTKAEIDARQNAAKEFKREGKPMMRVPDWLRDEGRKIWRKIIKDSRGLDLYDILDTQTLAIYCDALAKYQEMAQKATPTINDLKVMQSLARIIFQYADKLGLTPQSRSRLIKRRADEIEDEFGKVFD
jgi:phage terminase small subunit